ncbi:4Fe-4S dicluster protein [Aliiruegeria haliotis]|uniref:4Fe-4S dicluster protein n=1 Tax=Aliiruegeria haliotis TaxID=1280846 RepID=A0A2T0S0G4_9RHOB|nr:4Fe-4S dicluster domain-containing protein [Aliiruegeria haliotis]PRY26890.1 4Fe-4S dicluster protein [Aliiruegeria haliotis]
MRECYALDDPRLLLENFLAAGWRVIAPVLSEGALVPDVVQDADDLPRGILDSQAPGHYRLEEGATRRWFDAVVGPRGWKHWLHPPERRLWRALRNEDGFEIRPEVEDWPPTIFFGVRACDLAAIARQAEVFRRAADPAHATRVSATRIVAVNCGRSARTCFCVSTATGPRAEDGFDLALTETDEGMLVEVGTDAGASLLEGLGLRRASDHMRARARARIAEAAASQTRALPKDVAKRLPEAAESPRWEAIAKRCLHCTNCTAVCPTCFCTDIVDRTDLSDQRAERWERWDSCFTPGFSEVHGGPVRSSGAARYRQWMTHKLSGWHQQFGTSGCTGCGRCITWCPAGIDLVAEARALTEGD